MTNDTQIIDNVEIDVAPKLSLFNDFFEIRLDFNSAKQHELDIKIIAYLNIANNTREIEMYRSKGTMIINVEKVLKGKNLILARVKRFDCEEYEKNFHDKKRYSDFSIVSVVIERSNEKIYEKKLLLRTLKENCYLFKNLLC